MTINEKWKNTPITVADSLSAMTIGLIGIYEEYHYFVKLFLSILQISGYNCKSFSEQSSGFIEAFPNDRSMYEVLSYSELILEPDVFVILADEVQPFFDIKIFIGTSEDGVLFNGDVIILPKSIAQTRILEVIRYMENLK